MSAPRREIYTEAERVAVRSWLAELVRESVHTEITHLTVSEWAEQKRVIPEELSALPGPFRWDVTPYLREIADCLSATSPVQEIAVMKGAQIGFSVGVLENWLGYIIDVEPGPAIFVQGDKEMAEEVMEVRIDRMLQSAGIGHKIFSQAEKNANKKTGDTKKKKEFPGGWLRAIGPNSASKLRSAAARYELLDEIEAYPNDTEGEGDPLMLLKRRTDSFEAIRKILYGSTPGVKQTSKIEPLFLLGDQRRYFVPCKNSECGELQPLEWSRLKWTKTDEGKLDYSSVHYECRKCGAAWKNEDKAFFLREEGHGGAAKWEPTAKAARPGMRSYHISSLYSPIGMRSWESIVEEWLEIGDDQEKLKAFINTVLGETFTERGEAPRWEKIYDRREPYRTESRAIGRVVEAEWPERALFLTMAADVQKNRIEAELVAWGAGKESWSLGYFVLTGETEIEDSPVWDNLFELLSSTHCDRPILAGVIDCGFNTPAVYKFCEKFSSSVFAIKGEPRAGSQKRPFDIRPVPGYTCQRIDLNVDFIKQEVYQLLEKAPSDTGALPAGYCHFPEEYGQKYFEMLTAEERKPEEDKRGHVRFAWTKPHGRRNEALDVRAYNLGALYAFATALCGDDDGKVDWEQFWEIAKENTLPAKNI